MQFAGTLLLAETKYDSINLYYQETIYSNRVFLKEDLSLGYHKIKIVSSGKKQLSSFGNRVTLERLIIQSNYGARKIENKSIFTGKDISTKGSWKNVYGSEGYDIICDSSLKPTYAILRYSNANLLIWTDNSNDIRALQKFLSQDYRIAAQRMSSSYIDISLIVCGNELKDVSLYLLDFDDIGRKLKVSILDGDTLCEIHSQSIDSFEEGVYLKYRMRGSLIIRITRLEGANSTFSGIFFD